MAPVNVDMDTQAVDTSEFFTRSVIGLSFVSVIMVRGRSAAIIIVIKKFEYAVYEN